MTPNETPIFTLPPGWDVTPPPRGKVYLVTTGSYSDFKIRGVFSSKEKAEAFIAKRREQQDREFRVDCAEIEELTIDDETLDLSSIYLITITDEPRGMSPTGVQFLGSETDRKINKVVEFAQVAFFDGKFIPGWTVAVKARDEQHAVKIGNDLIRQYQAQSDPAGEPPQPEPAAPEYIFSVILTERASGPSFNVVQTDVIAAGFDFDQVLCRNHLSGGHRATSWSVYVKAASIVTAEARAGELIREFRARQQP